MIKDKGRLKKSGGNVASCFCTPDGRLIHAVGGPIKGKTLHDEAWWATEIWRQIKSEPIKDPSAQAELVHLAHREFGIVQAARRQDYLSMLKECENSSVWANQSFAAKWANQRFAVKRPVTNAVHRYFAHGSLSFASVLQVGPQVFSLLTRQKYVEKDKRIELAAEGIELAQKEHRPIVLVFYRGTESHNPAIRFGAESGKTQKLRPDNVTQTYMNWLSYQRDKSKDLKNANIVFTPVSQQPALSALVDLPVYNLNMQRGDSFTVVVANPDGSEVASQAMSHEDFPAAFDKAHKQRWNNKNNPLADALAQATETAIESRAKHAMEQAASMRADGKRQGAVRLLKKQLREPLSDSMMVSVKQQLEAWK